MALTRSILLSITEVITPTGLKPIFRRTNRIRCNVESISPERAAT